MAAFAAAKRCASRIDPGETAKQRRVDLCYAGARGVSMLADKWIREVFEELGVQPPAPVKWDGVRTLARTSPHFVDVLQRIVARLPSGFIERSRAGEPGAPPGERLMRIVGELTLDDDVMHGFTCNEDAESVRLLTCLYHLSSSGRSVTTQVKSMLKHVLETCAVAGDGRPLAIIDVGAGTGRLLEAASDEWPKERPLVYVGIEPQATRRALLDAVCNEFRSERPNFQSRSLETHDAGFLSGGKGNKVVSWLAEQEPAVVVSTYVNFGRKKGDRDSPGYAAVAGAALAARLGALDAHIATVRLSTVRVSDGTRNSAEEEAKRFASWRNAAEAENFRILHPCPAPGNKCPRSSATSTRVLGGRGFLPDWPFCPSADCDHHDYVPLELSLLIVGEQASTRSSEFVVSINSESGSFKCHAAIL